MEKFVYILVHGAWHGSWVWNEVAKGLRTAENHKVYTPDLPGHGKSFVAFDEITFNSYVSCIESLIACLEDVKVILVGHSMAGAIISQVAERIPNKVAALVYVSGFVPEDGNSIIDEEKCTLKPSVSLEARINEQENRISIKHSARLQELFYGWCSSRQVQFAKSMIQDQPLKPFLGKVKLTEKGFGSVPKIYIECTQDRAIEIDDQRRMYARINPVVYTLDTDHSPFFSKTQELVDILLLIGNSVR